MTLRTCFWPATSAPCSASASPAAAAHRFSFHAASRPYPAAILGGTISVASTVLVSHLTAPLPEERLARIFAAPVPAPPESGAARSDGELADRRGPEEP